MVFFLSFLLLGKNNNHPNGPLDITRSGLFEGTNNSLCLFQGLATSRPKEIHTWFSENGHRTNFVWDKLSAISTERAFSKKKVEERRVLLQGSFNVWGF